MLQFRREDCKNVTVSHAAPKTTDMRSRIALWSVITAICLFGVALAARIFWLFPTIGYGWRNVVLHLSALLSGAILLFCLLTIKRYRILFTGCALTVVFLVTALLLVHDVTTSMSAPLTKSRVGLTWFTGLYCKGAVAECFSSSSAAVHYVMAFAALFALLTLLSRPIIERFANNWWHGEGQPSSARTLRRLSLLTALVFPAVAILFPLHVSAMDPLTIFVLREPVDAPPELLLAKPGKRIAASHVPESPRPLIVIIVDALRADHVETREGRPTLTPFLQKQRSLGLLHNYGDAITMCSASYCGITGILGSASWAGLEAGRPLNLMDALARYGYQSHLLLSGPHRQAFNYSLLYGPNVASISEQTIAGEGADDRSVLKALQALKPKDPQRTALVIHLMSAHPGGLRFTSKQSRATLLLQAAFSKDAGREYQLYYDEGVRQSDRLIENIVGMLQQKELDDALIIITADHGEGLGGPGGFFHGSGVNVEVAKVPFLVIDPRKGKWPEHGLVSTLDVAPTLLRAIGGKPLPEWQGMALQDGKQREVAPIDDVKSTGVVALDSGRPVLVKCELATGRKKSFDLNTYRTVPLAAAATSFAKLPRRKNADRCR
jgi:hypothetical protein